MRKHRIISGVLGLALAAGTISFVPTTPVDAAAKLKLSKTKITLKVSQKKVIKVKGTKKKVKWKLSKKGIVKLKKKGKTKVMITAKKAGKVTIKAKIKGVKKKLKCVVKVVANKETKAKSTATAKAAVAVVASAATTKAPVHTPPVLTTPPISSLAPSAVASEVPSPVVSAEPVVTSGPVATKPPVVTAAPTVTPTVTPVPTIAPPIYPVPEPKEIPEIETYQAGEAVQEPFFTYDSGAYGGAFELQLASQEGTTIYYTTDGSVPTKDSIKYDGTIQVIDRNNFANVLCSSENVKKMALPGSDYGYVPKVSEVPKCTVIRAVAIADDGTASKVVTNSYFVGNDLEKQYPGAKVISLVTDPKNLLDPEIGIYVLGNKYDEWIKTDEGKNMTNGWFKQYYNYQGNYTQKGKDWERPANVEYIDPATRSAEFNVPAGIRLHGGASRMYTQRSFNVYMKEEYGQKNLKYPLIPGDLDKDGKQIKKYKRFMIRNGGNDTEYTKFQDIYIQNRVKNRAYATQACTPVVLFLNGEYWGLYNMGVKYSDSSVEETYGIDSKNVVIYKEAELDEGNDEDQALYDQLMEYADSSKKDMKDDAVFDEFCNIMDIDSFADYYATELYIANQDWNLEKNYEIFRAREVDPENPYADGKWRYMLYDTEQSMDLYGSGGPTDKTFTNTLGKDGLFANAMRNEKFQTKFMQTVDEICDVNFKVDECLADIDNYAKLYKPLMEKFFDRFYGTSSNYPRSEFDNHVQKLKNFVNNRAVNYKKEVSSWCEKN
ncbi:CotH kinase family protein [Eubacterium xylanophilum]|uniref:CotH kinase family protein n=1 Tax=Eubacterium xylanophilum TaxID=39497 RepID=UPI00047A487B|nr:CotH kinase family protein [Eubacterium xylanophilum]